jgi:hypothetical protein
MILSETAVTGGMSQGKMQSRQEEKAIKKAEA